MPFKSQAQRRKFAELLVQGKISPDTFEEWNRETGSAKLPERATPKRRAGTGVKNKRTKRAKKTKTGARKAARRTAKKGPRRARKARRRD